jgi:hypothetical protein
MGLNGTANPSPGGNGNGQAVGANVAFTKFLFVTPRLFDDGVGSRVRAAGGTIARGFFNDFDIDGSSPGIPPPRENQSVETIQFLMRDGELPATPPGLDGPWLSGARYALQVSSKYRPRLEQLHDELKRRLGDAAEVHTLDGAVRNPRYSSAEMQTFMYKQAPPRRSGRVSNNAIILPLRKLSSWWEQSALERNAYFDPHVDRQSGCPVKGHAHAAEAGIPVLYRRVYHNPDGYQRSGEFDFITYFECADDALPTFERICAALRDTEQNPEWRFVEEGPVWQGKRVLRW